MEYNRRGLTNPLRIHRPTGLGRRTSKILRCERQQRTVLPGISPDRTVKSSLRCERLNRRTVTASGRASPNDR